MKHVVIFILALTFALAGCSEKKKKRRGAAAQSAPAAEGAAPAAEAPAAEAPAPEAEAEPIVEAAPDLSVEGVPDYEVKAIPSKAITKAQKHNSKGIKHHIKKRYDKAAEEYINALTINPRYTLTRYNLACAFALMGEDDKALGLLKQMKAIGSWRSLERVQKSKKDKDFTTLHNDPRFIAITEDVSVEQPNYKRAAKRFRIQKKSFRGTFADERHVRIVRRTYHPDGGFKGGKSMFFDVANTAQLDDRMRKWFSLEGTEFTEEDWAFDEPWFVGPTSEPKWKCKKMCCKTKIAYCDAKYSHLNEVCFWPITADNLVPTKVGFQDCDL